MISMDESDDLIDLYTLLKIGKSDFSTEFHPKNLNYLKKSLEIRQDIDRLRMSGNLYKSSDLVGSLKQMGYADVEANVVVDGALFPAYSKQQ